MDQATRRAADRAFRRAEDLQREILDRYPDAWARLDRFLTDPPMEWPSWCLLPMAGAAAVATDGTSLPWRLSGTPPPIAALHTLWAWRYSRSVWLFREDLAERLLTQVPDVIGLDDLTGLPEWCVYIAAGDTDRHFGMFAHLECDMNSGRPELRLLFDLGGPVEGLVGLPVYLDRPTVTEALADARATATAMVDRAGRVAQGLDVRGAHADAAVAAMADQVDGYMAMLAYLARPEADVRCADRAWVTPVKPRRPMRDRHVWIVGHGN